MRGWELVVLDTTDLSIHGGWSPDSAEHAAAVAYMEAHLASRVGSTMAAWARLNSHGCGRRWPTRASLRRVILVSHHCLAAGACRETHLSWNGDEVVAAMRGRASSPSPSPGTTTRAGTASRAVCRTSRSRPSRAPAGQRICRGARVCGPRRDRQPRHLHHQPHCRCLRRRGRPTPTTRRPPASVGEWLSPAEALPSSAAAAAGLGHLRHATAAAPHRTEARPPPPPPPPPRRGRRRHGCWTTSVAPCLAACELY